MLLCKLHFQKTLQKKNIDNMLKLIFPIFILAGEVINVHCHTSNEYLI